MQLAHRPPLFLSQFSAPRHVPIGRNPTPVFVLRCFCNRKIFAMNRKSAFALPLAEAIGSSRLCGGGE